MSRTNSEGFETESECPELILRALSLNLVFRLNPMVLRLDGNSERGAHARSNLCHLIYSRHLIRSRAVTNRIFFNLKRPIFIHLCATSSDRYHKSTMDQIPSVQEVITHFLL